MRDLHKTYRLENLHPVYQVADLGKHTTPVMELTITPSHTWLFLEILNSLAQITTAVGVLAWYCERRSERRREPPTQDTEDLIMFEDEVTFDSSAEDLARRCRPRRICDGQCRNRLEARACARRSTPKYTFGSCHNGGRFGEASFSAPRLYDGGPRGLRHRPPPPNAASEDKSESSGTEETTSTTSTGEPVRRNSAGFAERGGLRLPKPKKRSRRRSTSSQPSTGSENTEGKPKGSIAKSKGKRNDELERKTSTSSSNSAKTHSPRADRPSKRSRRASSLPQSFTGPGSMEDKLEGSVAQFKGKGKSERRRGTSTRDGNSSRTYSPETDRLEKQSDGRASGSAKGKDKARVASGEERGVRLGSQPARKKQRRDQDWECHTSGSGRRTKSSRSGWEEW